MKADDGMNLACDIGGVHSATSCNITLGDYKLTLGKLYTMNIYCKSSPVLSQVY